MIGVGEKAKIEIAHGKQKEIFNRENYKLKFQKFVQGSIFKKIIDTSK